VISDFEKTLKQKKNERKKQRGRKKIIPENEEIKPEIKNENELQNNEINVSNQEFSSPIKQPSSIYVPPPTPTSPLSSISCNSSNHKSSSISQLSHPFSLFSTDHILQTYLQSFDIGKSCKRKSSPIRLYSHSLLNIPLPSDCIFLCSLSSISSFLPSEHILSLNQNWLTNMKYTKIKKKLIQLNKLIESYIINEHLTFDDASKRAIEQIRKQIEMVPINKNENHLNSPDSSSSSSFESPPRSICSTHTPPSVKLNINDLLDANFDSPCHSFSSHSTIPSKTSPSESFSPSVSKRRKLQHVLSKPGRKFREPINTKQI
jgi:hypothetical protein